MFATTANQNSMINGSNSYLSFMLSTKNWCSFVSSRITWALMNRWFHILGDTHVISIHSKPIRSGYKNWVLCGHDGYPYQVHSYQGHENNPKGGALGTRVVNSTCNVIENMENHEVCLTICLYQFLYWNLSDCNWTQTHNYLVHKRTPNHLAKLALNDWAVLWVLICMVHLTVCSWLVTYAFQSESTFYNLASLDKWLSVHLRTKWLWVRVQLQPLKLLILHLFRARSSLKFKQL